MVADQMGPEGKRFFPFIFTLFFFVLMGNLLGLLPYAFTYTSHIAVTGALAVMVIVVVTGVAIAEHGLPVLHPYFLPERRAQGAGAADHPDRDDLLPVAPGQPVHPSVRQHGRRPRDVRGVRHLRRHAGRGHGAGPADAVGPMAINVALMGFELLVAALQAYVFAVLTCIYLHDAVHLH